MTVYFIHQNQARHFNTVQTFQQICDFYIFTNNLCAPWQRQEKCAFDRFVCLLRMKLLTATYWKTHECAENLHLLDQALTEALRCMNWAIKHQSRCVALLFPSVTAVFTQKESEHVNISKSQKWFVKRNVSFWWISRNESRSRPAHTSSQKQLRNKKLAWRKWSLLTHHSSMCCSFCHFYFHQWDFVLQ